MRRHVTEGEGLPKWPAPISHAVVVDDHCWVSGQLSVSAEGHYVPGTIREEAQRAFANLFAALRAAGFAPEHLVFIDVTFADLADAGELNAVWAGLFPDGRRPARTIAQVAALPYGAKIKLVGVAARERAQADEAGESM